jgi:hypothetical protein
MSGPRPQGECHHREKHKERKRTKTYGVGFPLDEEDVDAVGLLGFDLGDGHLLELQQLST